MISGTKMIRKIAYSQPVEKLMNIHDRAKVMWEQLVTSSYKMISELRIS